jgi:hypothetical protein
MSRSIIVFWDFGDTDLETLPYAEALRLSKLPEGVSLPLSLEGEDEISDWLSDTYGFTHFGWVNSADSLPSWTE